MLERLTIKQKEQVDALLRRTRVVKDFDIHKKHLIMQFDTITEEDIDYDHNYTSFDSIKDNLKAAIVIMKIVRDIENELAVKLSGAQIHITLTAEEFNQRRKQIRKLWKEDNKVLSQD